MAKSSLIRKDDQVVVICGRDKGKIGKVLKVLRDENRVLVEKVNMVKRHSKPSAKNRHGGIIDKEASIHLSNVMLLDPKSKKATRVGVIMKGDKKVRISKKSEEILK